MLNKIYNELVQVQFVENYTKRILVNKEIDIDEVTQYCYLQIFEYFDKHKDKAIETYQTKGINGIRQICSGIIHRQICSKNSPFYNQYIKKNTRSIIKRRTNDTKQKWNEVEGWNEDNNNNDTTITEDTYNDLKEEFELKKDNEFIHTFKQLNELEQSILLTYIENKTYTETAKAMGVSTPVIRRIIEKIRIKYKKIYNNLY